MNEIASRNSAEYILPSSVVSKVDVSRLVREMERIDRDMSAASVRAKVSGSEQVTPVLSEALRDFLMINTIQLATAKDRAVLITQLRTLKDTVPVLHMTFAVEADRNSLMQLTEWLRTSIHPQAVIHVGLQPGLVAGVYLRTPNRVHDLSLRAMLASSRSQLKQELGALRGPR